MLRIYQMMDKNTSGAVSLEEASNTRAPLMANTLPKYQSFDIGTNYVPEDMHAIVHKGERIIPAADNTKLMTALENKELIAEIRKLNEKIESLEQTVAQGSLMNAQATERNTVEISTSIKKTGASAIHAENIRNRVK